MRCGDLVAVAVSGDYGKPRSALVIQTDHLPETDTVPVCLLTTPNATHRCSGPIAAGTKTGLLQPSRVMVDKIMTIRRDRCGKQIAKIDPTAILTAHFRDDSISRRRIALRRDW